MFVQKTAFEKLVKHVQSQQQEIEKLEEMLGILAQSQGKQFEFVVGKGWKLATIRPEHIQFIDDRRKGLAHQIDYRLAGCGRLETACAPSHRFRYWKVRTTENRSWQKAFFSFRFYW